MSDVSAILDYEELSEGEELTAKRQLLMCPADNSQDMGTYDNLCTHWSRIHQAYTLLYLCPFQGCGCKKMMQPDIRQHVQEQHQLSGDALLVFDTIPAVVQVVPNRNYRYPGDHSPLSAAPEVPGGTFRFNQKVHASRMLQEKLRGVKAPPPTPATCSAPPAPPAPQVPSQAPPQALSAPVHIPGPSHQEVPRMTTTLPATSSRRVVDRHATVEQLEAHLRGIRHKEVALWQERDEVLHRLERRSSEDLAQLRQEVQALRQRVEYLEGENKRLLKPDREPRPTIVGHLEAIPSTRALVVYPSGGHTAVYPLDGQDLCILDLPNRTPCLSSDSL